MQIYPFKGLRYTDQAAPVGHLASPPYDQIDPVLGSQLHRNPRHFSHLTVPRGMPAQGSYDEAAALHSKWLREGLISPEPQPCFYPYEILSSNGDRRLGLTALIGLEDLASGSILGHEQTVTETIAERLSHLRTVRADLEPIFLLCDDAGRLDRILAEEVGHLEPCMRHQDLSGHRHTLFKLDDKDRIGRLQSLLTPLGAMIADGHHRYEVASRYAEEIDARAGTPAAAKLSVISSLASEGVVIDPVHRGLSATVDLNQADVEIRKAWTGDDGTAFAEAVNTAKQPALGVWDGRGAPEIWRLVSGGGSPEGPGPALSSSVYLLHHHLYPKLGLSPEATTDGSTLYRSDPQNLWEEVRRHDIPVGFWLPSMSTEAFASAVDMRLTLPPKSTRFLPKLVSGLVWASHESKLG